MPYRDLEPAVAHIGRELQAHVRQRRSRRDRAEQRLLDVVTEMRLRPSREIVDAIFLAVQGFRGDTAPNDDMTAVAIRITNEGLKADGSGRFPVARRDG